MSAGFEEFKRRYAKGEKPTRGKSTQQDRLTSAALQNLPSNYVSQVAEKRRGLGDSVSQVGSNISAMSGSTIIERLAVVENAMSATVRANQKTVEAMNKQNELIDKQSRLIEALMAKIGSDDIRAEESVSNVGASK